MYMICMDEDDGDGDGDDEDVFLMEWKYILILRDSKIRYLD